MHYLVFDCETGGLSPIKHALLTAYFVIYDSNWNFIDELDIKMKPDKITADQFTKEALKVTGINLGEHLKDPETLTYTQARAKILEFLGKHKIAGKRCHYLPVGQNVTFDVNFLKFQGIIPEEEYSKLIHHTCRDTFAYANFLKDLGYLPDDMSLSLGALADFFEIPPAAYHNAKADVGVTVLVYKAMISCYSKDKNKALSGVSDSILNIIESR